MDADTNNDELTYELLDRNGKEQCHFRFSGIFEGQPVVWDAELVTLSYYCDCCLRNGSTKRKMRQFIDVGDMNETGRYIHIGLNIASIDEPAILKTIIMIRQYKHLSYGRHEFGKLSTF